MIGNIENFYYALTAEGYYLPKLKSPSITGDYLWKVLNDNVFRMKTSEIKFGVTFKNIQKNHIFEEIENLLIQKHLKPLGFYQEKLPDKDWLKNLLFTLNPQHHFFSKFSKSDNVPKRNVDMRYVLLKKKILK